MFEKIGLSENVIKSKEFSIHNPENNEKICDFSFEVTREYHRCKREYCLFFKITSTPVSETVFFRSHCRYHGRQCDRKIENKKNSFKKI